MFELLKSGGILMIPIIICGIFATFIIIERCFYFSSLKRRDAELRKTLDDHLKNKNFDRAVQACDFAQTPLAQCVKKAIVCRDLNENDMRELVQAEMDSVVPQFEHWLTLLATIANISTLLGLFGTVTGNIKAFSVLGSGGSMGNPAVLAGAIAEALVTTASGLFVAIPSLIFSNYLNSRVDRQISTLEGAVTKVMLRLTGRIS